MKYKKVNMPIIAYNNLKIKQERMSNNIFKITGKRKVIPLTKVMIVVSKEPVWLDDKEIVSLVKKNGRRI